MAQFFFDSASAPQNVNSVPEAQYKMVIKAAEEKATKDGMGSYINFRLEIVEGPQQGFSFFEMVMFNLPAKPRAQDVGRSTLRQLVIALYGQERQISDLSQFCGIPLLVTTKNQTDTMSGNVQARCKGFAMVAGHSNVQRWEPAAQYHAATAGMPPPAPQQYAQPAPQQYAQPAPAPAQYAPQPQPQYPQGVPAQQYAPQGQPQYQAPQYRPNNQDVPF